MRRLLVPIVVAVPILAAAATAWGVPPDHAKPIDGSVQFGFLGAGAPAGPVEDQIYPALGGPAMTELTAPLPVTAGGTVTFNVDGPHQPLVYRLHGGETVESAIATLQARANETIPNPNPGGTPAVLARRRMAGQDPFIAPTPGTPSAPDELTAADRDFGFRYLSETKAIGINGNPVPVTSPALGAGTYVMLCNVKVHSFRVPQPGGAGQNMRAIIDAAPNGPPA